MTKSQGQQFVEKKLKSIFDLAQDPNFIKTSIQAAKDLGMTAKEWNDNKAAILLMFANEIVAIDRRQEKPMFS